MNLSRRTFIARAGSLAALTFAPARFLNATPSDGNQLLAFSDFEVDTFEDLASASYPHLLEIWARDGLSISSNCARNGSRSALSRQVHGMRRAELYLGGKTQDGITRDMLFADTYWIGFSLYIPENWATNSIYHESLMQLHQYSDYASWGPPVGMYVSCTQKYNGIPANSYGFTIHHSNVQEDRTVSSDRNLGLRHLPWSVLDDRGKWVDWVIQYRPDWRLLSDGGVGLTRIWKNGQLVIDHIGPNAYNWKIKPYLKLGVYKWDWATKSDDPVSVREYYFDELRVSRANVGSYESVRPGQQEGLSAPNPPTIVG